MTLTSANTAASSNYVQCHVTCCIFVNELAHSFDDEILSKFASVPSGISDFSYCNVFKRKSVLKPASGQRGFAASHVTLNIIA